MFLLYKTHNEAAAPNNAPKTVRSKIMPIKEITKPAIANPLGSLNTPTNDKINPNNHNIQPNTGTHPRKTAIRAKTNPLYLRHLICFEFD